MTDDSQRDLPRRERARRVRATFPAGTVSGAPKIRAMQIIAELAPWDSSPADVLVRVVVYPTGREGTTRGPYAGCVSYFSFNGNLCRCNTNAAETMTNRFQFRSGVRSQASAHLGDHAADIP